LARDRHRPVRSRVPAGALPHPPGLRRRRRSLAARRRGECGFALRARGRRPARADYPHGWDAAGADPRVHGLGARVAEAVVGEVVRT
ncbi:MAG: hypothetical protein DMD36_00905, partial [Gemmatimonadetes bacterium]